MVMSFASCFFLALFDFPSVFKFLANSRVSLVLIHVALVHDGGPLRDRHRNNNAELLVRVMLPPSMGI